MHLQTYKNLYFLSRFVCRCQIPILTPRQTSTESEGSPVHLTVTYSVCLLKKHGRGLGNKQSQIYKCMQKPSMCIYVDTCECTHNQMHCSLSIEKILPTLVLSNFVIQVNLTLLVSFTVPFYSCRLTINLFL